jgi:hypothetical protein
MNGNKSDMSNMVQKEMGLAKGLTFRLTGP